MLDDVYEELNGKISIILDGGHSLIGLESTVIDLTEKKQRLSDMVVLIKKNLIRLFLYMIIKKN